jgi:hypothetical protein
MQSLFIVDYGLKPSVPAHHSNGCYSTVLHYKQNIPQKFVQHETYVIILGNMTKAMV